MRCTSHCRLAASVRMSAKRYGSPPSPPSGRPRSVPITSSSRHFSSSYSPASQISTLPAPYSPFGIVPANEPYASGWSSVCTASRFCFAVAGSPFGTAHDTSTPSCSSRKS